MAETSKKHKEKAPESLSFAVVTISTSRYKESQRGKPITDESGDIIIKVLRNNGHKVVIQRLVSDDRAMIQKTIRGMLDSSEIDAIITSGGTGITPSDVTIEAVAPLLEKELPGFGELFRHLTYQDIGSAALMSRAIGGVAKGKAVFCLPGSPHAVKLCLERLILPETAHIVLHARGK
ncbi:MAG TPA: MogA/MoaB family molybdenum cofactor biosynthesis protein [Candidatus Bathyarchaeia archaeon]|nr:MogA/MoaB family molybdenum cofactor biosynthesis protein [Candidatus Bathyarchaeia archaeon]